MVATLKGCIKPKALTTIADFVLIKLKSEQTDVEVLFAIEKRCRTVKKVFVPELKVLFGSRLQIDMAIDYYEARVFAYFCKFNNIVESHGLQGVLERVTETDPDYEP
ncbi:TPA: hypothetical protein N0F65_002649 [Lagenidium giganteum]|uniref:Uncharacterized protein n=1 Tax=Lagenidium giganteum TaxID=4803 RepID=A0AAV2Z659_9STRA|nr:TPA: hypothetical protein N0F65_002649 [Lagenidium giganteum]